VTKIRIPRSVRLHYMTIKTIEEYVVYEDTSGEKTVYSLKSGSSGRVMTQEDLLMKATEQWFTWKDILKLAETEPSLRDLVEKAEIVYALLKEENK